MAGSSGARRTRLVSGMSEGIAPYDHRACLLEWFSDFVLRLGVLSDSGCTLVDFDDKKA
jgi:hypothetical protein